MKKKFISVAILSTVFSILTYSQVTEVEKTLRAQSADTTQGWKKGGVIATNLAQTSLTNWAAGGQNSLAINGLFSLFANMKKGKSVWDNSLDLGYGILKQGKDDFRKTDDKIDFLSKYGRQAFKSFYYAAMVNFKTQMTPGYNYPADVNAEKVKISNLFAPAYLLAALGLDYKPNANFSAFLAPATAKFTFVTDDDLNAIGAFGVDTGKTTKSEFGGYLRAIYTKSDFKGEFMKNISFTTKLDLFTNYAENPQNIDVSWETLIAMKVNKFITVSFNTHLLYDDNIKIKELNNDGSVKKEVGSKVQFKEILGVGFSYKF